MTVPLRLSLYVSILLECLSLCSSPTRYLNLSAQTQTPLCFHYCWGHSEVYQANLTWPRHTRFLKINYCLSFAIPIMEWCIKVLTIHVPTRTNMHVLMPPFKERWNFLISWELLVLGHLCPDSWEQIYWSPAIKHLFNHEQMLFNHERSPQTFSLSFHWTVCSKPVLKVGLESYNTVWWRRDMSVN